MRPLALVLALASPALLLALSGCGAAEAKELPTHLVLVAVDGLRPEHLGCYGAATATPAIDALAQRGVRFERACATSPEAGPALATLLTGLYPTSHGVRARGDRLTGEAHTLPEILARYGYRSFAAGDALAARADLAQGFERAGPSFDAPLRDAAAEALPFVALVHVTEPALAEPTVATLCATLRELGIEGRTVLVLAGTGANADAADAPLGEERVRVPLVVAGPAVEDGEIVAQRVSTVSLLPTLLDVFRYDRSDLALQGLTLVDVLEGRPHPLPPPIYVESPSGARAVVEERFELVRATSDAAPALYELGAAQRADVSADHPDVARWLGGLLERHERWVDEKSVLARR